MVSRFVNVSIFFYFWEMKEQKSAETILLDKFLKREFPFIVEVSSYELKHQNKLLYLNIYVSPQHFCELYFNGENIESRFEKFIYDNFGGLIKSIIIDWTMVRLSIRYYPVMDGESSLMTVIKNKGISF